MCGRFTLTTSSSTLARFFGLPWVPDLTPRYNIAPTQPVPTLFVLTGDREFRFMRWGLVPSWAKDLHIGNRMINARAESVAEKPAFRAALRQRRCIVMADGFYEWDHKTQPKQPYRIGNRDETPIGFAGLWEQWQPPQGGKVMESCTIITTEANELVAKLHDRMPVILEPKDYDPWLNPEVHEPERVLPLLRPFSAELMEAYPVSGYVNNPAHESPECCQRLQADKG